jgi:hypothetical protein
MIKQDKKYNFIYFNIYLAGIKARAQKHFLNYARNF